MTAEVEAVARRLSDDDIARQAMAHINSDDVHFYATFEVMDAICHALRIYRAYLSEPKP